MMSVVSAGVDEQHRDLRLRVDLRRALARRRIVHHRRVRAESRDRPERLADDRAAELVRAFLSQRIYYFSNLIFVNIIVIAIMELKSCVFTK